MTSILVLRKSSVSSSARLALSAVSHLFSSSSPSPIINGDRTRISRDALLHVHHFTTTAVGGGSSGIRPPFSTAIRGFHAGRPLRAAGFAATADFSDDEKKSAGRLGGSSADAEGLEISKLGIANDIVSALAGKGITKLFPIQVDHSFLQEGLTFAAQQSFRRRLDNFFSYNAIK